MKYEKIIIAAIIGASAIIVAFLISQNNRYQAVKCGPDNQLFKIFDSRTGAVSGNNGVSR